MTEEFDTTSRRHKETSRKLSLDDRMRRADLDADVLDDLLMMDGDVLEAPIENSVESREHDFAPTMVEEADSDTVVLYAAVEL